MVLAFAHNANFIHAALAYHPGSSTMLGESLPTHSKRENTAEMVLVATETRARTISLALGEKFELYNINPGVDGFQSTRGWFLENLFAGCEELE